MKKFLLMLAIALAVLCTGLAKSEAKSPSEIYDLIPDMRVIPTGDYHVYNTINLAREEATTTNVIVTPGNVYKVNKFMGRSERSNRHIYEVWDERWGSIVYLVIRLPDPPEARSTVPSLVVNGPLQHISEGTTNTACRVYDGRPGYETGMSYEEYAGCAKTVEELYQLKWWYFVGDCSLERSKKYDIDLDRWGRATNSSKVMNFNEVYGDYLWKTNCK